MEKTIEKLVNRGSNVGYKVVRAYCADIDKSENNDKWMVGDVHVHYGIQDITSRLITDPFDEVFINTPNIPQSKMQEFHFHLME
jgi:hypothetical protein